MWNGTLQIVLFLAIVVLLTKPMGAYMARVFAGERTFLSPAFGWLERLTYRVLGIDPDEDQPWHRYAGALLAFSLAGLLLTYVLLRV